MALVLNDRVKETSTTTGTGTFDLAGAATGFQTFVAGIGDTNTTYYAIFNQGTAEWEVGLGTVTDAATDTLARTTLISSSTGSAVSFTSGTKDVFCTLPASKAVFGKQGGTNFTGSLKIGDTTTGTLSSAQYNVGIGALSMGALSSGDYNTTVGAVSQNTLNTGIGNSSLGYSGLQNIQGGDKNIGLGYQAGDNITSGSGNVVIGNADVASATADDQLSISDGEDGTVVWITGDSSGVITFNGAYAFPAADGSSSGDVLQTDAAGTLTFATPTGGAQITDETKTFSNYSNITASRTLTLSSGNNYMLIGPITVNNTYTWDIAGSGELTLV